MADDEARARSAYRGVERRRGGSTADDDGKYPGRPCAYDNEAAARAVCDEMERRWAAKADTERRAQNERLGARVRDWRKWLTAERIAIGLLLGAHLVRSGAIDVPKMIRGLLEFAAK